MEIGSRVSIADVNVCYATLDMTNYLEFTIHIWPKLIQLYMMNVKQICCNNMLLMPHRVLTS